MFNVICVEVCIKCIICEWYVGMCIIRLIIIIIMNMITPLVICACFISIYLSLHVFACDGCLFIFGFSTTGYIMICICIF